MKTYLLSYDPGKKHDPAALQLYRKTVMREKCGIDGTEEKKIWRLDMIQQWKWREVPFQEQVDSVSYILREPRYAGDIELVMDATGIGEPLYDMFCSNGVVPWCVYFTGGHLTTPVYTRRRLRFSSKGPGFAYIKGWNVPKEQLVKAGLLLMQQGRFAIVRGLKWKEEFRQQLIGFKGVVNEKTGRVKLEADTESLHDDMVCAYLMAAWYFRAVDMKSLQNETAWRRLQRTDEGFDPFEDI